MHFYAVVDGADKTALWIFDCLAGAGYSEADILVPICTRCFYDLEKTYVYAVHLHIFGLFSFLHLLEKPAIKSTAPSNYPLPSLPPTFIPR
jgi:hypothetical protein